MMLNSFSSLIEVITAVYFTMCIDDVLKSLWTPRYMEKVNRLLSGLNDKLAQRLRVGLEKHFNKISCGIKKQMRIRSIFMIIFCLLLLLFVGLEEHSQWLKMSRNESALVASVSFCFLTSFVLGRYTLRSYARMLVTLIVSSLAVIASFFIGFPIVNLFPPNDDTVLYGALLVALFPIAWQIVQCWACSCLYYDYLEERSSEEAELLERAKLAYQMSQPNIAPVDYIKPVVDDLNKSRDDGNARENHDTNLEHISEKFLDRMDVACRLPLFPLLVVQGAYYKAKAFLKSSFFDAADGVRREVFCDNVRSMDEAALVFNYAAPHNNERDAIKTLGEKQDLPFVLNYASSCRAESHEAETTESAGEWQSGDSRVSLKLSKRFVFDSASKEA